MNIIQRIILAAISFVFVFANLRINSHIHKKSARKSYKKSQISPKRGEFLLCPLPHIGSHLPRNSTPRRNMKQCRQNKSQCRWNMKQSRWKLTPSLRKQRSYWWNAKPCLLKLRLSQWKLKPCLLIFVASGANFVAWSLTFVARNLKFVREQIKV